MTTTDYSPVTMPRRNEAAPDEGHIRSASAPSCCLCGSRGAFVYSSQADRLFGAPGRWNLKQCSNHACRLIWLDPMPLPEDLAKAYTRYYTHAARREDDRTGWLKRIYRVMKRGYLASRYNYEINAGKTMSRIMGKLLYLFPLRRAGVDAEV